LVEQQEEVILFRFSFIFSSFCINNQDRLQLILICAYISLIHFGAASKLVSAYGVALG
jgi:hypothetical protein